MSSLTKKESHGKRSSSDDFSFQIKLHQKKGGEEWGEGVEMGALCYKILSRGKHWHNHSLPSHNQIPK